MVVWGQIGRMAEKTESDGRAGITKRVCMIFYGSARWVTRSDGGSENEDIVYFRWKLYFGCDLDSCVLRQGAPIVWIVSVWYGRGRRWTTIRISVRELKGMAGLYLDGLIAS